MAQWDHHFAWGLTQLATYVEEEPPTECCYCNNAFVVERVAFIGDTF